MSNKAGSDYLRRCVCMVAHGVTPTSLDQISLNRLPFFPLRRLLDGVCFGRPSSRPPRGPSFPSVHLSPTLWKCGRLRRGRGTRRREAATECGTPDRGRSVLMMEFQDFTAGSSCAGCLRGSVMNNSFILPWPVSTMK